MLAGMPSVCMYTGLSLNVVSDFSIRMEEFERYLAKIAEPWRQQVEQSGSRPDGNWSIEAALQKPLLRQRTVDIHQVLQQFLYRDLHSYHLNLSSRLTIAI